MALTWVQKKNIWYTNEKGPDGAPEFIAHIHTNGTVSMRRRGHVGDWPRYPSLGAAQADAEAQHSTAP